MLVVITPLPALDSSNHLGTYKTLTSVNFVGWCSAFSPMNSDLPAQQLSWRLSRQPSFASSLIWRPQLEWEGGLRLAPLPPPALWQPFPSPHLEDNKAVYQRNPGILDEKGMNGTCCIFMGIRYATNLASSNYLIFHLILGEEGIAEKMTKDHK